MQGKWGDRPTFKNVIDLEAKAERLHRASAAASSFPAYVVLKLGALWAEAAAGVMRPWLSRDLLIAALYPRLANVVMRR